MKLRPLAPLAVIGAGLLAMSLATRSASADENGAPESVDVASVDGGLLVTWDAPFGSGNVADYDVTVSDANGVKVLSREVVAKSTWLQLSSVELGGRTDLTVVVSAEYGSGSSAAGERVHVSLPAGPAKPSAAPSVRAEGGLLKVGLPDALEGVTGRVVQLYRDGDAWATVSVAAGKALVSREVAAGHSYAVAYQDVNDVAAGALSERTAPVTVRSTDGPGAVRTIKLKALPGGLEVRWSAAASGSTELTQYQVKLVKDGQRMGTAVTDDGVQIVVIPSAVTDGVYGVTVTAVDAAGHTSSTTVSRTPKQ